MAAVVPVSNIYARPRSQEAATSVVLATRRTACARVVGEILRDAADIVLLGDAIEAPERLLVRLEHLRPQVLLLDTEFVNELVRRTAGPLLSRFPRMRVLLMAPQAYPGLVRRVVQHGFHGFLLLDEAAAMCVNAIRGINRGELWMPRAALQQALFDRSMWIDHREPANDYDAGLTRREAQAVAGLRRGLSNKQIAHELDIKVDTVKKHLRNAYAKIGIHRRTELMAVKDTDR
jgi:DNA-binding NarL/FixJ family response regulator